jgi:hypothetical protein
MMCPTDEEERPKSESHGAGVLYRKLAEIARAKGLLSQECCYLFKNRLWCFLREVVTTGN